MLIMRSWRTPHTRGNQASAGWGAGVRWLSFFVIATLQIDDVTCESVEHYLNFKVESGPCLDDAHTARPAPLITSGLRHRASRGRRGRAEPGVDPLGLPDLHGTELLLPRCIYVLYQSPHSSYPSLTASTPNQLTSDGWDMELLSFYPTDFVWYWCLCVLSQTNCTYINTPNKGDTKSRAIVQS